MVTPHVGTLAVVRTWGGITASCKLVPNRRDHVPMYSPNQPVSPARTSPVFAVPCHVPVVQMRGHMPCYARILPLLPSLLAVTPMLGWYARFADTWSYTLLSRGSCDRACQSAYRPSTYCVLTYFSLGDAMSLPCHTKFCQIPSGRIFAMSRVPDDTARLKSGLYFGALLLSSIRVRHTRRFPCPLTVLLLV